MKRYELSDEEWAIVCVFRDNAKHARNCGAFNEKEKGDTRLMFCAALQRAFERAGGNAPSFHKALSNYAKF